jgi:putative transposase
VHHSDRGSQYASHAYLLALEKAGIQISMSRIGNCLDNAAMESFFSSLKTEWVYQQWYATRADAMQSIFYYIEAFYNRQRLHSSLAYTSPPHFEAQVIS